MRGKIYKFIAFSLIIIFVLAVIPQKPLDKIPYVEQGPGPADYVVKPTPALDISGNHIYVKFELGGKAQTVHGIVYGKPLGSSSIVALYLPGFRWDAEKSINDFRNRGREPDFTLIVLDPPGKGETTGPAQELDNVLGDGVHPNTSYIRRYIEFAYATILAFYYHGTPIEYVAGHSMGATTIMGLITIEDPALDAVKFYAPMAIAGFREESIRAGTFLNRFTKDMERDTRLVKYFDVAAFPDKVRYPVIMINGMHDRVYSIRTMVRTAKVLEDRGKLISHVLVPDAGHRMCKEFAESFEARVHIYAESPSYEVKSEIVYDNDYRHYSGSVRITPADYKFSLSYTEISGEKVYLGSNVVSDKYSVGYFVLYLIIALAAMFSLAMMREFVAGLVTILLGYRRFRDPGRFLIASFGKLFRFRIPLQILITAFFVVLSRRNRRIPVAILLIAANVISIKLMHSIILPGPYLAALIVLRLLGYTKYKRYIRMIEQYVGRACRRFYNRFL